MKFRVYRSFRSEKIDTTEIGQSWAMDECSASSFSRQFGVDYIVVSAIVTADQINIAQTNAQWNSKEHASEMEVVLNSFTDIQVEIDGEIITANTGDQVSYDETRPAPVDCDPSEVTDYLEQI